jgi:F0F1-type ATP synthase assembly protein I
MDRWHQYAELSGAALTFVGAVLIAVWLGRVADDTWGGGDLWTLAFLILGSIGAVFNLLRTLKKIGNANRK